MNTLTEIKNAYAIEQGYEDWADLYQRAGYYDETKFFKHEDAVIVLVAKAALEKAYERLNPEDGDSVYESITDPENLIR